MFPTPRPLSLPEEFVLLAHLDSGKVHNSVPMPIGCAVAELGELVLRRKLLIRPKKSKMFGFDAYRLHGIKIEVLDTGRTGLAWADMVLTELQRQCTPDNQLIGLNRWLRSRRREAFPLHRNALVERGVLHQKSGFLRNRYYPDRALRDALVTAIRAVYQERIRLDEHLLFLFDLVESANLDKHLGCSLSMRQRLDRGRGNGMVEFLPEDLRDSSTALTSLIPTHSGGGAGSSAGG